MMKYKLFGNSGLRVSEVSLGTITFGTDWGWGADAKECRSMFNAYAEAGGNFIDTANRYTEGSSERIVGECIKSDRDQFVVATKYTLFDRRGVANFSGNHRKNMMRSVHESLKRLDTEYIDILWLHAWDFLTPVEEVMRGLDDLVRAGKVHYLGISDTPAWIVARANTLAELRGWTAFCGLQIEFSLLERTPERELIPMAKSFGMTVTPWGPLGGGALTGKYLKGESGRVSEKSERRSERSNRIASVVVASAEKMGVTPAQLALRWTMQQDFSSIPIVGSSNKKQLQDSLGALNITIPDDIMSELNQISRVDPGFPHEFLSKKETRNVVYGGMIDRIVQDRIK
jgi:aryl-alcohol dehydrogenase-like predicted oxidoreductase